MSYTHLQPCTTEKNSREMTIWTGKIQLETVIDSEGELTAKTLSTKANSTQKTIKIFWTCLPISTYVGRPYVQN